MSEANSKSEVPPSPAKTRKISECVYCRKNGIRVAKKGHICEGKKAATKALEDAWVNIGEDDKVEILKKITNEVSIDDFGDVQCIPEHPFVIPEAGAEAEAEAEREAEEGEGDGEEDVGKVEEAEDVGKVEEAAEVKEIGEDIVYYNADVQYEVICEKTPEDKLVKAFAGLSVFELPNTISFVAWNTRTLASIEKEDLNENWEELCKELARHDIITLTEILPLSSSQGKKRFDKFTDKINKYSDEDWTIITSKAAGPGKHKHIHVMMVKVPIKVETSRTFTIKGIDYSPLVVHIKDERMKKKDFCGDFIISSIHMPPNRAGNAKARSNQIRTWMNKYRSDILLMMNRCFSYQGAKDAIQSPTIHIMQGDWNEWIGNYPIEISGFDIVFSHNISTSGGHKPYDNFIISKHYSKYLNIFSKRVLRFKQYYKARTGASGLSDHAPIMFELEVLK